MPDSPIPLARDLIHEVGVEDAWRTVLEQGGHPELLVEINRYRRWQHRREPRGGRA